MKCERERVKLAMGTYAVTRTVQLLPAVMGALLLPAKDKGKAEQVPLERRSWVHV